jgi:hypothetical protein
MLSGNAIAPEKDACDPSALRGTVGGRRGDVVRRADGRDTDTFGGRHFHGKVEVESVSAVVPVESPARTIARDSFSSCRTRLGCASTSLRAPHPRTPPRCISASSWLFDLQTVNGRTTKRSGSSWRARCADATGRRSCGTLGTVALLVDQSLISFLCRVSARLSFPRFCPSRN